MAIKRYKPTSPGRRQMTAVDRSSIDRVEPEKSLVTKANKHAGRSRGRIAVRHKGGGHKRRYRIIDFKRDKMGIPARVATIEYDPNRTANIALLHYADGEKRYILAPVGLHQGDTVEAGTDVDIRPGNAMPLRHIPLGTTIHNVEMVPGKGGQIGRAAGAEVRLVAKEGKYAHLRMPSGEVRLVPVDCIATIGQVGNVEHEGVRVGKAGRNRWIGKRPAVRGSAMNPVDHPHGGGEGKAPRGRHPVSPWGKLAKGGKTRKRKKSSDRYIVRSRKRGRR